jgi:YjbR protein
MTRDGFKRLALGLEGATEESHMGHPDFRVRGRIFATLGYPDAGWGMVKLTPEQQRAFVDTDPAAFVPAKGAWGSGGATCVRLDAVTARALRPALALASSNIAQKAGATAKSPSRRRPVTATRKGRKPSRSKQR